ncbi:hypothetical protein TpMuguga_01g00972 [Theileria parva strain Muguga]|uniref:Uncharacterized protein n=1 Tax=Theileria parva TaxID=5875 RepID=Q4N748_THEPA|nr:uncharacterized protein TpMuguga_01g00972 [Theileria parva strain Muguga]EAN34210.1 hypothetical protein TpMuguga_01g00972 [Theileria parva strain Muguga]|eukprot:XP_766493.1 hypothetical protein [Theileria parva strain Muguga]
MFPSLLFYLNLSFIGFFCKLVAGADFTLDLDQKSSNDKLLVNHTTHYGIATIEFYTQVGFHANKVVQSTLPVWEAVNDERVDEAVLYFGREALSLLFLNVRQAGTSIFKYYVKVKGKWAEVLEPVANFFVDVDRSSYTVEELDSFALDIMSKYNREMLSQHLLYPQSYNFIIEPVDYCALEITNPARYSIMKQTMIGAVFSHIYTPKIDFGFSKVSYDGHVLWSTDTNRVLCSSVWTYFKGEFDTLILVSLYDFVSKQASFLHFMKTDSLIVSTSEPDFQKQVVKMTSAEYDAKDIKRYINGYLTERDLAFVISTTLPIVGVLATVLFTF